ncbi:hypothetical protein MBLNU230_g2503t1 [Neophaeotheca triangularis]
MASEEPPRFLLFLPPLTSTLSGENVKKLYGDTVSQVLKEADSHSKDSRTAAILDVALACPHLVGQVSAPRSSLYQETQSLLAAVYKLICTTAAKFDVNIEDADGVDVRVLLVAWNGEDQSESQPQSTYGPIVTLQSLAQSGRQWQFAFGVESKGGEAMVKAFVMAKGGGMRVSSMNDGQARQSNTGDQDPNLTTTRQGPRSSANYNTHQHVAVGGTFDHIHIGHKLLLTMTIFAVDEGIGERSCTIGITGDEMLKNKKHAEVLESWRDRQTVTSNFLNSLVNFTPSEPQVTTRNDPGTNGKSIDVRYGNGMTVKYTEIQDAFGPTITEEAISALVLSGETRGGGQAVNDKRKEQGWPELDVFEVQVLDPVEGDEAVKEGFESKLSSTAIREKIARKSRGSL